MVRDIARGNKLVESDARRVGKYAQNEAVDDPKELANRIFVTVYLGTENSSNETQSRLKTCQSYPR